MKKQLLSLCAALSVGVSVAQVPSPSLNINQAAIFPTAAPSVSFAGIKFLDAVDANVVWTIGYDAAAPRRNYNWYSRTVNGGTSFSGGNVYADTNTYIIANMEGVDANTAWVSSFMKGSQSMGAVHRTINGGTSWTNMTAAGMFSSPTSFCNVVSFFTPSIGIAMGDPVNNEFEIWRTTDGGLSWGQLPGSSIDNPLSAGEYGIVDLYYRLGSNNLWFGTNEGRMYRTTNAGVTWSVSSVGPTTSTLTEIAFSSANNGICTLVNNGALELWNTFDGGATWTQITAISPSFGRNDISGVPGTGALVSVDNQNMIVSSSTNNGVTWTDWLSTGIGYVACDFVNATTGWVGSYNFQTFTNMWKYSGAALSGTTAPTAAFSLPGGLCLSGPSATVSPINNATGSPAPTFSWSVIPAGATLSNATASVPVITFNSPNSYTVLLTASNGNGTVTASQIIVVSACTAPTASFTLPANACTNFTFAAVNNSAGAPAPSNFWSILPANNTTLAPSAIASNPVFRASAAGIYTITLVTSNASGTATASRTLSIGNCPPNASFSIPTSIRFCDVKTFSTTNQTSNPTGVSGTINYTWTVLPNVGLSITPNRFVTNMVVNVTDPTIPQYTVSLNAKNPSGVSTATALILMDDCTTGIADNSLRNAMDVYPNPVRDQLNITLPIGDNYSVKITNLLGSVVYSETTSKEKVSINLANVARGVYFVTVESKTEKVTRKVVLD